MDARTLGAVGLMLVAMSLIPLGDTAGKLLTERGADPFFVAFARFAVGAAMIAAILGGRIEWRLYRDARVWLRAGLIAAAIACILTALRTTPLAAAFGAFFVGPAVAFAASALLLRERVNAVQAVLVAVGFGGVLLVVRPGFGMTPGLGFALAAGVLYGLFLTASRWIADLAPPRQLMLSQTALGTLLLAPLGLAETPAIDAEVAGLLLWSGVASATGNLLLVLAMRRADASLLSPLVYTQLVAATALGWAAFDEVPDRATVAGLAILLAAGLGGLLARPRGSQPAAGGSPRR